MQILGYLPMPFKERKTIIKGFLLALGYETTVLGDLSRIAKQGLDYAGRYEQVFQEIRSELAPYAEQLHALFALPTIDEQVHMLAPQAPLGSALDRALDRVMSQENLVGLFGEKATANRVQEFSRHFAERIRAYAAEHKAAKSPWLAHLLLGNFYDEERFDWLMTQSMPTKVQLHYEQGLMNTVLATTEAETYNVIHLSNILDWLTQEEATETLALAYKALKPGGIVIIRQLNSNLAIPLLGQQFKWDSKRGDELTLNDRSFFYRHVLVGVKPALAPAPRVTELADKVLQEIPVIKGSFFNELSTMSLSTFQRMQTQFFFAVDYFSRPMAALIARLPLHEQRIDILRNIVEEHGDFLVTQYHSNTFKKFLETIGVAPQIIASLVPSSPINMFNYTLMNVCTHEDPLIAIACNGIIEYAYADISALLAQTVIERRWIAIPELLVHYNLHADLDKKHAQDFFQLLEPAMDQPEKRAKVLMGLRLGAHIFNRLYEDLYRQAQLQEGEEQL
jgi:pyrroloquinoline quinone (PQQ) biosynthesis protein C